MRQICRRIRDREIIDYLAAGVLEGGKDIDDDTTKSRGHSIKRLHLA